MVIKKLKTIFLLLNLMATLTAQTEMPLYEGSIPNAKADAADIEKTAMGGGIFRISEVSKPTLTRFSPTRPNGQSVIICPGGGYAILAASHEGVEVAKALNELGVTAFVLKYRLPSDRLQPDRRTAPLMDAQQAIRLVRKNAVAWQLNPQKIGIMGFSAGGHLAATASTLFAKPVQDPSVLSDTTSVRPDFSILIYPVISFQEEITHKGSRKNLIGDKPSATDIDYYSNELHVSPQTPPVFLVHSADDSGVSVENSLRYYQACVKHKVPAEMHLYPKGGHGYGMLNRTTADKWFDRLANWLSNL